MKLSIKLIILLIYNVAFTQTNLLDTSTWTVGTGSVSGFSIAGTDNENIREMGLGPHGISVLLWKTIPEDTGNTGAGGWNTDFIDIDHTKSYRFTVWIKKTNSFDGSTYFRAKTRDSSGLDISSLNNLDGSYNSNPFFEGGDPPTLDSWYLYVGYIHRSDYLETVNIGGVYSANTGVKILSLKDFIFESDAIKINHNIWLSSNTNTLDSQFYYGPTVYEVNGQEPTIQELIDGPRDTQAPTAPTLSSTSQTDTTVDLSWSGATDDTAVTGYKMYKDGVLETTLSNVLTYQITGLTASTSYNFTATALDTAGNESLVSNTITITTDSSTNTAEFFTLEHIRATDDTVIGTITEGYTITESNATAFNVNVLPSSSVGSIEFTLAGPISNTHIESITPYALYSDLNGTFQIGPDLTSGTYSLTVTAWSESSGNGVLVAQDIISFVVTSSTNDTQAPTVPTLSTTSQSDTSVDLSWTASTDDTAVTGYKVYKDGVLETILGNVLTYQVTGLTASTSYNFTVIALDFAGNESVVSNTLTITTDVISGNIQVFSSIDSDYADSEEAVSTGIIEISSTDLELFNEDESQEIGLHFKNLNIPSTATITNAYVQFSTDEESTGAVSLNIYAEASDNPLIWSTTNGDITSRTKTNAFVQWSPPDWNTIGERGVAQQTPDLTSVIQEIIGRSGYASTSPINIIFSGVSGGSRVADSYTGSTGNSPKLFVTYNLPSDNQAPTTPILSSTSQTDTTVDLSWTAATDDTGVIGYKVYKDDALEATLGNVLTYQVTALTAVTTYNFTVTALDALGYESIVSNIVDITTSQSSSSSDSGNWTLNNQDVYYNSGNVGIGTSAPDEKLTVKGSIHSEEVKVDLSVPAPDYVFETDYTLTSLEKLQNYIKINKHLPNIPSAKEMEANGVELGFMNMKLLEKIEELTLYILEQESRIKKLEDFEKNKAKK